MMIFIASEDAEQFITLREVAESQNISVKYLEQLVGNLTHAGLLTGRRGIHGGYALARPAEEISAGDIIRACEGSTAPVACLDDDYGVCPRRDHCQTIDFWEGLDAAITDYVDGVTLADLRRTSPAL